MPPTLKKKPKFRPDQIVVATRTFATADAVVHVGEKYRGGDPLVVANHTAFIDGNTLPSERPNFWNEMPPPPEHEDSIRVGKSAVADVPPDRLVRSRASFWFDAGFAPGSQGEKSGKISGFGTSISIGQLVDISSPVVRQHPQHFEWPRRDVTLADVERLTSEDAK
jgi:hypothetical protein